MVLPTCKQLYYTFILLCTVYHMESYRTIPTYMYTIISKNQPTIPTPSMRFMLGLGTDLVGRFQLFPSVRYYVLPGAVRCIHLVTPNEKVSR